MFPVCPYANRGDRGVASTEAAVPKLNDAAYVQANAPIVREQLQKAGVRLAHLLDSALGK